MNGNWNQAITVLISTVLELDVPDPTVLFPDSYSFTPDTFREFLDETSDCCLCKTDQNGILLFDDPNELFETLEIIQKNGQKNANSAPTDPIAFGNAHCDNPISLFRYCKYQYQW